MVAMIGADDRILYAHRAYVGSKLHKKVRENFGEIDIQVHEKGYHINPLTEQAKESNRKKSRIRARVVHVRTNEDRFGRDFFENDR
jgi:IS5 family transposase